MSLVQTRPLSLMVRAQGRIFKKFKTYELEKCSKINIFTLYKYQLVTDVIHPFSRAFQKYKLKSPVADPPFDCPPPYPMHKKWQNLFTTLKLKSEEVLAS